MLKYVTTEVVFSEIPDEVTLAINISNCPIHCPDCHSKELWRDIGIELSYDVLNKLILDNPGISCVCFMGGDSEPKAVENLAKEVKENYPNLKVGWYSGNKTFYENINLDYFDYIKVGPYIKDKGGLKNSNTNQRLYMKLSVNSETTGELVAYWQDITYKFWSHEK